MAPSPGDANLEVVLACHESADAGVGVPGGHTGHAVKAEQGIHGEPLKQSVGQHGLHPQAVLLAWLEYESDGAVEATLGLKSCCGAENHRHVAIVAASVHPARILRGVGQSRALINGRPSMSARRPMAPLPVPWETEATTPVPSTPVTGSSPIAVRTSAMYRLVATSWNPVSGCLCR